MLSWAVFALQIGERIVLRLMRILAQHPLLDIPERVIGVIRAGVLTPPVPTL